MASTTLRHLNSTRHCHHHSATKLSPVDSSHHRTVMMVTGMTEEDCAKTRQARLKMVWALGEKRGRGSDQNSVEVGYRGEDNPEYEQLRNMQNRKLQVETAISGGKWKSWRWQADLTNGRGYSAYRFPWPQCENISFTPSAFDLFPPPVYFWRQDVYVLPVQFPVRSPRSWESSREQSFITKDTRWDLGSCGSPQKQLA